MEVEHDVYCVVFDQNGVVVIIGILQLDFDANLWKPKKSYLKSSSIYLVASLVADYDIGRIQLVR